LYTGYGITLYNYGNFGLRLIGDAVNKFTALDIGALGKRGRGNKY
jgi:hypothetical protein